MTFVLRRFAFAAAVLVMCLAAVAGLSSCAQAQGDGLQDGTYRLDVVLEGGTGRASVVSPCEAGVEGGEITATVKWTSSSYDKMVVDGREYTPVSTENGSTFEIPVSALDTDIAVSAQTTAMGSPHMVDYTLRFSLAQGDDASGEDSDEALSAVLKSVEDYRNTDLGNGWQPVGSLDLEYAENFTVDYYEGGYQLICIANGERFLTVPQGSQIPENLASDIAVIMQPASSVYLVATNAICLVDAIGATDAVAISGVEADSCSVEGFSAAIEAGDIVYGGKYNTPDYELISSKGCDLAIESTMINHNPDVKEKLQKLGVTVLTEQSSYEEEALGRLEWIKLYGALFGRSEQAQTIFEEQANTVREIASLEPTGKTVAFFYINSNGAAVTRQSGDYVPQMISLAGGDYIFNDLGEGNASTVTLEMEEFYAMAKDADYIVYNATIDGAVGSIEQLVDKNPLLEKFKAVREGNVWCTDQDMYQQMIRTGAIIGDMHAMLTGSDGSDCTFLFKLA